MDDLIAEFRLVFSEFADESVFPQSVVYFWMNLVQKLCSEERFGSVYKEALFLLTAHKLSIWLSTQKAAQGGNYGKTAGQVQSKSVGNASITYATASDNGNWSEGDLILTAYGRAYLELCAMLCQGVIQL